MSVRFDAQADRLVRTTNIPALDACTISMFVYLVVDTNTFSTFSIIHDIGLANYQAHQTDSDGVTQSLFDNPGTGFANGALTVGRWYFVAYTASPTTQWMYRWDVENSQTFIKATSPESNAHTFLDRLFFAGHDIASEPLNGRIFGVKVWDAVLTEAELEAERWSATAVRTANLNSNFPMLTAATRLTDTSGNGRDLTEAGVGSWTTEADPNFGNVAPKPAFDVTTVADGLFDTNVQMAGAFDEDFLASGPSTQTIVDNGNTISITAGSPTVKATNVIVDNGNAISITAGTPKVVRVVKPNGASIAITAGSPTVTNVARIIDNGNTISITAGAPAVKATNVIVDNGNNISITAGTPTVTNVAKIVDNGNAISITAGAPTVTNVAKIVDNGNTISITAGSPVVKNVNTIVDNGNTISLTFGQPTVAQGASAIHAQAAIINLSAGTPAVVPGAVTIVDNGNTISITAGTPTVRNVNTIIDNGNSITLSAGIPAVKATNTIVDNGNTISITAGTPKVTRTIRVQGATINITAGVPAVKATNAVIDNGNSISITAGTPTVKAMNIIADNGNTISITAGTPTVKNLNRIIDNGNVISLSFGAPTITSIGATQNINAQAAIVNITAGTPRVQRVVKPTGSTLTISAGVPTLTQSYKIQAQSAHISITAGVPSIQVPASNFTSVPVVSNRATSVPKPLRVVLQISHATPPVLPKVPLMIRNDGPPLQPTVTAAAPLPTTLPTNTMRTFTLTPKVE